MEGILTTEDVAKILRLTPLTVRVLAQKGEIPGRKVGSQWRFRRTDIDQMLNSRKPKAA